MKKAHKIIDNLWPIARTKIAFRAIFQWRTLAMFVEWTNPRMRTFECGAAAAVKQRGSPMTKVVRRRKKGDQPIKMLAVFWRDRTEVLNECHFLVFLAICEHRLRIFKNYAILQRKCQQQSSHHRLWIVIWLHQQLSQGDTPKLPGHSN